MSKIPELFGIDIASNSLKLCQVRGSHSFEVANLAYDVLDQGILSDSSELGVDNLAKRIQLLVKNSRFKTKNCVLSLPESTVFSRLITLPKVEEKDLNEAIHWAIRPLVPVAIETLNVSYLQIDSSIKDNKELVNWYVVAAPKDLVKKYQNIMERAGLNLLAVETEALAVTRLIFTNYEIQKDILILDLGAKSSNIILSRNSSVLYSQTISTGSDSITKVIAADYGLDELQSEKYKVVYGLDFTAGEGKIARSIQPVVDLIVNEVNRILSYYKEKIGGEDITEIYLTGGGSNLLGLDKYIFEKLALSAIITNNFKKIRITEKVKNRFESSKLSGFNVALGLSLKGLTK